MIDNGALGPRERHPELAARFSRLEEQKNSHTELCERLFSVADGNIYVTDFVVCGILKRSLDTISGILALVERWNFTAAGALLRLQVDSVLRLAYLAQVRDAERASKEILAGKRFSQLKDARGQRLTDRVLLEHASEKYPWLGPLYEHTSKLIHLSEKHCFTAVESVSESDATANVVFGEGMSHWPVDELSNFLGAVDHVTEALLKLVSGWIVTKDDLHRRGILAVPKASRD